MSCIIQIIDISAIYKSFFQQNQSLDHFPCFRSPPPRRNTLQFAGPHEPAGNHQSALGFHNWQATKMTVKERISFLFNSSILSDVTFIVGRDSQQQRIPAHRFVLSVGSAVFDAMFNSTLATRYF